MPRRGFGSRSSNEGSGNQLFKSEQLCTRGACYDFDGPGKGRTMTAYSRISKADADSKISEAVELHNRVFHRG